jgi:competence protein ComEA
MQRVMIIMLAVLISVPLFIKSRMKRNAPHSAAFSMMSTAGVVVKVSGDVRYPGIYRLYANKMTIDAINMAVPMRPLEKVLPEQIAATQLRNGMAMYLHYSTAGSAVITVTAIPSAELIVLGIPLDINVMTAEDFDRLPGVGPALAQRIVMYRQNNGGIMSVEQLRDVEGIGEGKFSVLRSFFNYPKLKLN